MLQGKKILLGVTGSIAAYKSALLVRLLIKEGAQVRLVMTEAAKTFITPLTLSTLCGHSVFSDISDGDAWNNHVELGIWADAFVIAPCTASTLSKMATGHADNLLVATYLSARCPVFIAPAMDLDMWDHPSTKYNIQMLLSFGNHIIPVGHGFLASGLYGDGRMAEPEKICDVLNNHFYSGSELQGKKILITAGPTYEAIDPVRFIGNRSSGKMGFALAKECINRGAAVVLVSGPVQQHMELPGLEIFRVESAQEMFQRCTDVFGTCDYAILAAAVADFKPARVSDKKIKKVEGVKQIPLVETIDIAAELGKIKKENQLLVGFALETNDEIAHASLKLHKKNFDFIVLNSLSDEGSGFQYDTNKITILDKQGNQMAYALKSKSEVATDIIDYLISFTKNKL